MLRSMTGYSRYKKRVSCDRIFEVEVEMQSYNKRHLDIHLKVDREFSFLDHDIRKTISQRVQRGALQVGVRVTFLEQDPSNITVNIPRAKKLYEAISSLQTVLNLPQDNQAILPYLLQECGVVETSCDAMVYKDLVLGVVEEALTKLVEMKEKEGKMLEEELKTRLTIVEKIGAKIQERTKNAPKKHFERLKELLLTLTPHATLDEERLLKEVALLAEKVDITEELVRLSHHVASFFERITAKTQESGKTLEFLLQEMQREVNTIGSKSQDAETAQLVIEAKSEIEKMRAQVQNVE